MLLCRFSPIACVVILLRTRTNYLVFTIWNNLVESNLVILLVDFLNPQGFLIYVRGTNTPYKIEARNSLV